MATIPPVVSHMVLCDDIATVNEGRKVNILGIIHRIVPAPGQAYPLMHPQLCAYSSCLVGLAQREFS